MQTFRSTITAVAATAAEFPLSGALAYRLEELIFRYERETGCLRSEAENLFSETVKWLWACARLTRDQSEGKSVPTQLLITPELEKIDRMWHLFLLYTKDYQEFCRNYLGSFVHHVPISSDELAQAEVQRAKDPRAALASKRTELRPQLEYLYDLLGAETVRHWYLRP